MKNIAVVNPGFSADCIETLEEIAMRERARLPGRTAARNSPHIPCLNDSDEGMTVIEPIALRELPGWLETRSRRGDLVALIIACDAGRTPAACRFASCPGGTMDYDSASVSS